MTGIKKPEINPAFLRTHSILPVKQYQNAVKQYQYAVNRINSGKTVNGKTVNHNANTTTRL